MWMAVVSLLDSTQKLEDKGMLSLTQLVWVEGPLSQEFSETHNNCLKTNMCHHPTQITSTKTKTKTRT